MDNEKDGNDMLGQAIRRFANNLSALREFVDVTQPFLRSRVNEVIKTHVIEFGPVALALDALPGTPLTLTDYERQWIKEQYGGNISLKVEPSDGATKRATVTVESEEKEIKKIADAFRRLGVTEYHSHLLYTNSLIALISAAEWFLSEILHSHFDSHPDSAEIRGRSLSFRDLSTIGSIDEAQRYLIDLRVEEVLRGSFEDWIAFLKEKLNLSMSYIDIEKDKMVEICQRRHLLVHNGGHINQIYMNKVKKEYRASDQLNNQILVSRNYLDDAISTFERALLLIASELWKKQAPAAESRGIVLNDIAFERLSSESWTVAEGLSFFLMNDKGLPERIRTIGQLNYWQSLKWQDRFAEIVDQVRGADYSAKDELFQLAQYALLDDDKRFFEMLPGILKSEKLSTTDLKQWPIFRRMREHAKYIETYGETVKQSERALHADAESD